VTLNSKYTGALTFEIFVSSLPRRMIEHRTFKTVLEKLDKVHDLFAFLKKSIYYTYLKKKSIYYRKCFKGPCPPANVLLMCC
jgi:hypothetical protein